VWSSKPEVHISGCMINSIEIPTVNLGLLTMASSKKVPLGDSNNNRQPKWPPKLKVLTVKSRPHFQCSPNAKIYNPMYNTHLEFQSRGDDRPVCFSPAGCCSRLQCRTREQWSVYLIALAPTHGRGPPRPHPYVATIL